MFPCNQGIFDNIFGVGKLWDVEMQILHLISHVQCFLLLLTAVLLGLVSCVLYHLVQLDFLHFLSIFSDFWHFSPLHLKQYFANILCLFIFGIMVHAWPWLHGFSQILNFFGTFTAHGNIPRYEVFMLSHWFLVEWARNPRNPWTFLGINPIFLVEK